MRKRGSGASAADRGPAFHHPLAEALGASDLGVLQNAVGAAAKAPAASRDPHLRGEAGVEDQGVMDLAGEAAPLGALDLLRQGKVGAPWESLGQRESTHQRVEWRLSRCRGQGRHPLL